MTGLVRVAAVQMNSGNDAPENLRVAGELLERAAGQGARVAVLPENFSIMARRDAERRAVAEEDGAGPVQDFLSRTARQLQLWIVAGTTPLFRTGGEERLATSSLVYDASGARVARYDKIHLFDVDLPEGQESYRESAHFAPGLKPVVVDTPAGRLGLSVCYDIRFPELYRALMAEGAEWFTIPAAFTVPTGRAHWEPLLRARAIENLCPVVAAAQWGVHANGRATWGHSMIIDHWGRVVAELAEGVGVICADLDREAQREARRTFPALEHRVLR
jgi:deaminated glutathione amidase